MGTGRDREVPAVDRFDLLRQAIGSILRLDINDTVAVDALCPTRMHKLDACFAKAIVALRAHVLEHIGFSGSEKFTKILGRTINDDLRALTGELTRASHGNCSASTPPPAGTVFGVPPLPTFPSPHEFVRGGGTLFKLLRAEGSGGGESAGSAGIQRGREVVVAPKSKRRKSSTCYQFRKSDTSKYGDKCRFFTTYLQQPRPALQSEEGG